MKTELLAPRPDAIEKAAGILRAGGLVAIPTETVYGLAAVSYTHLVARRQCLFTLLVPFSKR